MYAKATKHQQHEALLSERRCDGPSVSVRFVARRAPGSGPGSHGAHGRAAGSATCCPCSCRALARERRGLRGVLCLAARSAGARAAGGHRAVSPGGRRRNGARPPCHMLAGAVLLLLSACTCMPLMLVTVCDVVCSCDAVSPMYHAQARQAVTLLSPLYTLCTKSARDGQPEHATGNTHEWWALFFSTMLCNDEVASASQGSDPGICRADAR
jgi:hypothetical protein